MKIKGNKTYNQEKVFTEGKNQCLIKLHGNNIPTKFKH